MTSRPMGSILIVAGILVVIAGLLMSAGWLNWFGRLPGDVRIVQDNFKVYIPITSMLLVSAVISVLLWLYRQLR